MMMKRMMRWAVACVAMLALGAQPADAQLTKILKKVNKAAETVLGTQSGASAEAAAPAKKVVREEILGGGTIENQMAGDMDVQVVGLYGEGTSLNYGNAYLVLKVRMNLNKQKVSLGHLQGIPMKAVDEDGNTYKPKYESASDSYDVTEGLWVKVSLTGNMAFKDVKKSVQKMQLVQLEAYIDYSHYGTITIRDIPVQWDVTPE